VRVNAHVVGCLQCASKAERCRPFGALVKEGVGTWGAGPFANDSAADFKSAVFGQIEGAFADSAADLQSAAFDTLEGAFATFQEVLSEDSPEANILVPVRFAEVRAAVVILTSLLRKGVEWSPAEDGAPAHEWQTTIVAFMDEHATAAAAPLTKAVRQELERFVKLAGTPGPRRPLPREGICGRFLRERGASRGLCGWAHAFGSDFRGAWRACASSGWLAELALSLKVSPEHILRAACTVIVAALETSTATESEAKTLLREVLRAGSQNGAEGLARHADAVVPLRNLRQEELKGRSRLTVDARVALAEPPLAKFFPTALRVLSGVARNEDPAKLVVHVLAGSPIFWAPHQKGPHMDALRGHLETPELVDALANERARRTGA
jgi:hypothetical protein